MQPAAVSISLSPDSLAKSVKSVPSGPRILPKLQKLLVNNDVCVDDILDTIRLDPGIAARVLQVANSAVYSKGVNCHTIEEAINRLGVKKIYLVVSNALCSETLARPLVSYRLKAEDFWRLSLAAGIGAECVATAVGEERDTAYTIGLLHGLGMVVIDGWLQATAPGVRLAYRDFDREYGVDESAHLQFTQAEAAAAMLRLWEFPEAMTLPLLLQYQRNVPAEHQRMVAVVRATKWLRNLASPNLPPPPEALDPATLQALRLGQSEVAALIEEVRSRLQESRDLLVAA
jgi:HD-like signal output (HDOD) protein